MEEKEIIKAHIATLSEEELKMINRKNDSPIKRIGRTLRAGEFIVTWIGLLITIISLFQVQTKIQNINSVIYDGNIEEIIHSEGNTMNADINNSVNNSDNIVNSGNTVNNESTVINNNVMGALFENNTGAINSTLSYAEVYYNVGEYESAFRIYSVITQKYKNSTAFMNLGYLYANGLGCESDDDMAVKCYDEAIALGCNKAYSNKLTILLRNKYDGRGECIKAALAKEDKIVEDFLLENYTNEMQLSESEYLDFMKNGDAVEIDEFLDAYFYDFVYLELIQSGSSSWSSNDIDKYVLVGTDDWFQKTDGGLQSGTVYTFKHYKLICRNINMLQERIIYQFELDGEER